MSSYGDVPILCLYSLTYVSLAAVLLLSGSAAVACVFDEHLKMKYEQFSPNLADLATSLLGAAIICLHFNLRQADYLLQCLEPVGSFLVVCFLLQSANMQSKQYCQRDFQPYSRRVAEFGRRKQILLYGVPFYVDFIILLIVQFAVGQEQLLTLLLVVHAVCAALMLYETALLLAANIEILMYSRKMNITQSAHLQAIITIVYAANLVFGKIFHAAVVISAAYFELAYGWAMWAKDLVQEVCYGVGAVAVLVDCRVVHQKIKFTYNLLNSSDVESSYHM